MAHRLIRASAAASAAALAAVLLLITTAAGAGAQAEPPSTEPAVASVAVAPLNTDPNDPNGGQWFTALLDVGKSTTFQARIVNPAAIPQTATFYLRDMLFNDDGTPILNDGAAQTDVGIWGHFDKTSALVPAKSAITMDFSVTVPKLAEPGDHLGALVVETAVPGGPNGLLKTVTRVATRLYVTVPGEATRAFTIEKVAHDLDSWLFPGKIDVQANLRNTGRMRISPAVKIGSGVAKGPKIVLSRSVEPYTAVVKVPFWGGPVKADVVARTPEGLVRQASLSVFVIPWGLILSLLALGLASFGVRKLWKRRTNKVRNMADDIRRLEQLVADQAAGTSITSRKHTAASDDEASAEAAADQAAGEYRARKRAKRAGAKTVEPKIEEQVGS